MVLTTKTINENAADKDMTPEYYTAFDSEGKGYLAKRKPVKEEEPVKEEKPVKKKRSKK